MSKISRNFFLFFFVVLKIDLKKSNCIISEKLDQTSSLQWGWNQSSGVDYWAGFLQLAKEERSLFTSPPREKGLVNMHCWALKPLSSPSWLIYLLIAWWGANTKWVLSLWLPNNHFILTVDIFPSLLWNEIYQTLIVLKKWVFSTISFSNPPKNHKFILPPPSNLSSSFTASSSVILPLATSF